MSNTETRAAYPYFEPIATRWHDVDVYGHVNNVEYYSYFDTLVCGHLIRKTGFVPGKDAYKCFAIETFCQFHAALRFPEIIDAGLRIGKLGNSSVRYEIGLFKQGQDSPAATGHFVHVFVDSAKERPVTIPTAVRAALLPLLVLGPAA